jgi:hypothetical protein
MRDDVSRLLVGFFFVILCHSMMKVPLFRQRLLMYPGGLDVVHARGASSVFVFFWHARQLCFIVFLLNVLRTRVASCRILDFFLHAASCSGFCSNLVQTMPAVWRAALASSLSP